MDQAKYPLMGNLAGKDWPRVLPAIKAMAYMMDYSDKSRTEEAAANFTTKSPGAAGNRPAGQQQRPKSPTRDRKPPFCKRCRTAGHLARDCPKARENEEMKAKISFLTDHLSTQMGLQHGGPAALPMANMARGPSSSRSGNSHASSHDYDDDWLLS
jgi:hypothetical protein